MRPPITLLFFPPFLAPQTTLGTVLLLQVCDFVYGHTYAGLTLLSFLNYFKVLDKFSQTKEFFCCFFLFFISVTWNVVFLHLNQDAFKTYLFWHYHEIIFSLNTCVHYMVQWMNCQPTGENLKLQTTKNNGEKVEKLEVLIHGNGQEIMVATFSGKCNQQLCSLLLSCKLMLHDSWGFQIAYQSHQAAESNTWETSGDSEGP